MVGRREDYESDVLLVSKQRYLSAFLRTSRDSSQCFKIRLFTTPLPITPAPVQVVRTDATGEDIRCKLTLQAASNIDNVHHNKGSKDNKDNNTDGAILALQDLSPPRPVPTSAANDTTSGKPDGSPPDEASNPTPIYLPVANIVQVRCRTNKTNATKKRNENKVREELFSFVFRAHSSTASRGGHDEAHACLRQGGQSHTYSKRALESCLCGGGRPERLDESGDGVQGDCHNNHRRPLRRRQVEPFGVLQAGSDEQLCAIVLGVASVM